MKPVFVSEDDPAMVVDDCACVLAAKDERFFDESGRKSNFGAKIHLTICANVGDRFSHRVIPSSGALNL
ncbi:hypothetical protein [Nannocystis radixulma]|uniref:Transposase n=1 Tax=Nannocystis radixulma TaxID=2995305 RepID=A0ABT5BDI1_9BACT|nr:hypothetical protein [Nannocystis radixulma]MDC0672204.1 hypothetical protein [Nannocystis radixulma]